MTEYEENYAPFLVYTNDKDFILNKTDIGGESSDIPLPSDASPKQVGITNAGISNDYSRADHSHGFDSLSINLPLDNLWCNVDSFFASGNIEETIKDATITYLQNEYEWDGNSPITLTQLLLSLTNAIIITLT